MSTDHETDDAFGEAIRSALHAGTSDLSAPPTLLPRLHQRYTRRIAARRAAVVGVPLAIAVLVGALTTTVNVGQPAVPPQVVDASTSAKITAALDEVADDVVHVVTVETGDGKYSKPGHPATIDKWVLADSTALRVRIVVDDRPVYDFGLYPGGSTTVDYRDRTWRQLQDSDTGNRVGTLMTDVFTPTMIKEALSTGRMRVDGDGEVVDGRTTIKIRGDDVAPLTPPVSLWIDRDTFLPIRSRYLQDGEWGPSYDFTWLPPTPENRDLLTVPVPEGFTFKRE